MKVEYFSGGGFWWWKIVDAPWGAFFCSGDYTRRRDAVRGFERFCARVRAM